MCWHILLFSLLALFSTLLLNAPPCSPVSGHLLNEREHDESLVARKLNQSKFSSTVTYDHWPRMNRLWFISVICLNVIFFSVAPWACVCATEMFLALSKHSDLLLSTGTVPIGEHFLCAHLAKTTYIISFELWHQCISILSGANKYLKFMCGHTAPWCVFEHRVTGT